MDVSSVTIPDLLEKLRIGEWLVPKFQRDFVWTPADVISLVQSVLDRRPIGMATLWEQADGEGLELEPLSIPDEIGNGLRFFSGSDVSRPNRVYAILDGRQRCTALAMAFGGFRATNRKYRYSGRYFLNVAENDPIKRILYIRDTEVIRRTLDKDATCIGQGLFPLSSNLEREPLLAQWYRYSQSIRDPQFYKNGKLPEEGELNRRNEVLRNAFEGIIQTKLAVFTVPATYGLSVICDIFETLNTSGTKVSTVDLIHSWLYADTSAKLGEEPLLLREWINELGQKQGAIGWASTAERPELIAQMVTASHLALDKKHEPRSVGKRSGDIQITSVKSGDLLATPAQHWRDVVLNDGDFADFIGDFQKCVAGGYFPWNSCPYPISASIYVALRWHHKFDKVNDAIWSKKELDALFRAFFWRNSLAQRYDQGFLTQLGKDLSDIKSILHARSQYKNRGEWVQFAELALSKIISKEALPSPEQLRMLLTDERPGGAMQKALMLPLLAGATTDLLESDVVLSYPNSDGTELHHIYPKAWCQNNQTPELSKYLNRKDADRYWVESVSNLMPLSRESNSVWRAKNPGQLLSELNIQFAPNRNTLESSFINADCFSELLKGEKGIPAFWQKRSELLLSSILEKVEISL